MARSWQALEMPRPPAQAQSWPSRPITHVVEEDDGLLVVAYSDVFRVDKALKSWKRVATLKIQYRWGRPDAIWSYPAVRAVHPPRHAGEPYVLATVADVADRAAVDAALQRVRAELGPVHVMVTCAGIESFQSVSDITAE